MAMVQPNEVEPNDTVLGVYIAGVGMLALPEEVGVFKGSDFYTSVLEHLQDAKQAIAIVVEDDSTIVQDHERGTERYLSERGY